MQNTSEPLCVRGSLYPGQANQTLVGGLMTLGWSVRYVLAVFSYCCQGQQSPLESKSFPVKTKSYSVFFKSRHLYFSEHCFIGKGLNSVHLDAVHMSMLCDLSSRLTSLAITRSTPCPCSSCSCWTFWQCWLASPWWRCRWTVPSCWCSCGSRPRGTSPRPCSGICTWRRARWGCRAPPPLRCRPPFPSCCWTPGRLRRSPSGIPSARSPWGWLEKRQKTNLKKKAWINRLYVITSQIRLVIDEECIHLQITCSVVFVNPSYLIKEHSFTHGWDMKL